MKFDVVRDPWIPVLCKDGSRRVVSIRDIFKDAAEFVEVYESNIFYEYGIERLLTVFFMDCYRPKRVVDKERLLEKGKFDLERFDEYIRECEEQRKGNCFDLYDEKVPFLQTIRVKELKKEVVGVGKIALGMPFGNNSVHFCNDVLVEKGLDAVELAKSLCSYNLFQPESDGPNSAKSISGTVHPYYFWIKRGNLFEEIIYNSITVDKMKFCKEYAGNVAWCFDDNGVEKELVKMVSLMQGMTFQNRRVLATVDEDTHTRKIYFGPYKAWDGSQEKDGKNVWRDPHAAYLLKNVGKKKKFTQVLRPLVLRKPKLTWLDMGYGFSKDSAFNPLTVQEMYQMDDEAPYFDCVTYSVCLKTASGQGPILTYGRDSISVPYKILKDDFLRGVFSDLITNVDIISGKIKSSIAIKPEAEGLGTKSSWDISEFFTTMRSYVFDECIPRLLNLDIIDLEAYKEFVTRYNKFILGAAISSYKSAWEKQKYNKTLKFNDVRVSANKLYVLDLNVMIKAINRVLNEKGSVIEYVTEYTEDTDGSEDEE